MSSSLPFSLGSPITPTKPSTPVSRLPLIRNSNTIESSSSSIHPQFLELNTKNSTSVTRRKVAIGLGFSLSLLDVVLKLQPPAVAAEAAPPCELTVAPSGLAFCDKVVGYGSQAVKGQLIKAHYVGKLENGKVFDSSYNRGEPLAFRVGVGYQRLGSRYSRRRGIPPMLAGGKRTLKLPPELGYGVRGAGCRGGSCIIPPDSVLLFDVEFVG